MVKNMDISKLDEVQRFAYDAEHGYACLGNAASGEFLLIPLDRGDTGPITQGELLKARLGNFFFCGVFGIVGGFQLYQAEGGFDAWRVMSRAEAAYRVLLAERLTPIGDDVSWLERLHALPDTRK